MEDQIIKPISEASQSNMLQTAKWAKNLGIISIVAVGVSILQSIITVIKNPAVIFSIITVLISSGISIFLAWLLLKFANKMKAGVLQQDGAQIGESIYNLKLYYTIIGILLIIVLSLFLIIIIGAVIVASIKSI